MVVRERQQATGTRTVKASVAYFVLLNHLDYQVNLDDQVRWANRGPAFSGAFYTVGRK